MHENILKDSLSCFKVFFGGGRGGVPLSNDSIYSTLRLHLLRTADLFNEHWSNFRTSAEERDSSIGSWWINGLCIVNKIASTSSFPRKRGSKFPLVTRSTLIAKGASKVVFLQMLEYMQSHCVSRVWHMFMWPKRIWPKTDKVMEENILNCCLIMFQCACRRHQAKRGFL